MRIGSLFSGIGNLELGLERAGVGHTVWQVERDAWCRRVLRRHRPHAELHRDVRSVGRHNLAPVDVLVGSFPCQDISSAGNRAGLAGRRSGLWSEFARLLVELRPEWCVVENVASGAKLWVDQVVSDMEQCGYEVLPLPLSAADCGAPHLRRRIFLVGRFSTHSERYELPHERERGPRRRPGGVRAQGQAKPGDNGSARDAADSNLSRAQGPVGRRRAGTEQSDAGSDGGSATAPHPHSGGREGLGLAQHGDECGACGHQSDGLGSAGWRDWQGWAAGPPVSPIRRMDDGPADGLHRSDPETTDALRLHALGNSVVVQCAEVVGHVLLELKAMSSGVT